MAYGELADIFHLADSMTNLYFDNKNYCGGNQLAADLYAHCRSEERPCSVGSVLTNVSKNHLIEFMGASSVLMDTYHNLDLNVEADEWYEQTLMLSKNMGLIAAFMIDF